MRTTKVIAKRIAKIQTSVHVCRYVQKWQRQGQANRLLSAVRNLPRFGHQSGAFPNGYSSGDH